MVSRGFQFQVSGAWSLSVCGFGTLVSCVFYHDVRKAVDAARRATYPNYFSAGLLLRRFFGHAIFFCKIVLFDLCRHPIECTHLIFKTLEVRGRNFFGISEVLNAYFTSHTSDTPKSQKVTSSFLRSCFLDPDRNFHSQRKETRFHLPFTCRHKTSYIRSEA